jgi:predicted nuclease with TOPRIM domain
MTSSKLPVTFNAELSETKPDAWDAQAVLEEALKEREKLLSKNPELHALQEKIDRMLEGENRFEERMRILGRLIGEKLDELHEECTKLEGLCRSVGIHAELPITRFKKEIEMKKIK